MPLIGPTSYPTTLQAFLLHWERVNERLGVLHPLVLPEGLTLAGAQGVQVTLQEQMDALRDAGMEVLIARETLQQARMALRDRLLQFGELVRAYWQATPWADLLPKTPQVAAAPEKLLAAGREALRLWTLLETEPAPSGAPVPLFLDPGGLYGRADFAASLAETQAALLALEEAEWARSMALARRDATLAQVKAALMAYNRAVPGRLPAGDPLVALMPALWPPPGHTPEPVILTARWEDPQQAAVFTWTESTDKLLDHYELRGCAGAEYHTEEESVLGRVPKDAPRELVLTDLLPAPHAVASYRLYVVLATENERGSATAVVTRPLQSA